MTMQRRLLAEVFGTFWLVLGGCGSAIFAALGGLTILPVKKVK